MHLGRGLHISDDFVNIQEFLVVKSVVLFIFLTFSLTAQKAPSVEFSTLSGDRVSLKQLTEKGPVLISFWALWCEPCRHELKILNELHQKYSGDGFTVFGINMDTPKGFSKVKGYLSSNGIVFDNAADPAGEYIQKFNGQSIPYALLIDKTGNIRYRQTGYLPGDEIKLEQKIKEVLEGK